MVGLPLKVGTEDAVVRAALLLARRAEEADEGVLADVVALAADEDQRAEVLIGEIVALRAGKKQAAAAAVVGDEHGVRVAAAEFAGRPDAPPRRGDGARVDSLNRCVEELRPFQEERTALGEEEGEALVR